jgi:hypothetical protein
MLCPIWDWPEASSPSIPIAISPIGRPKAQATTAWPASWKAAPRRSCLLMLALSLRCDGRSNINAKFLKASSLVSGGIKFCRGVFVSFSNMEAISSALNSGDIQLDIDPLVIHPWAPLFWQSIPGPYLDLPGPYLDPWRPSHTRRAMRAWARPTAPRNQRTTDHRNAVAEASVLDPLISFDCFFKRQRSRLLAHKPLSGLAL